ncbi:hypothetical protein ITP53_34615 [Nonomuraea sp. K274]|uniref:Uncharacterized protein n=1 Tax=Nonomuraea cypriaca TaxID=1187855 RepID=A0A931AFN5_9ACTN|nr:hypothetical protein [Nonomuraea cypriaca]MBF8190755.1 hypothetical protein [Nonomuraea cypriaca]
MTEPATAKPADGIAAVSGGTPAGDWRALLSDLGLPAPASTVTAVGERPGFDTVHEIVAASVEAISAFAAVVAAFWEQRGGAPQRITVVRRQAAAALHPTLYQRQHGHPIPPQHTGLRSAF